MKLLLRFKQSLLHTVTQYAFYGPLQCLWWWWWEVICQLLQERWWSFYLLMQPLVSNLLRTEHFTLACMETSYYIQQFTGRHQYKLKHNKTLNFEGLYVSFMDSDLITTAPKWMKEDNKILYIIRCEVYEKCLCLIQEIALSRKHGHTGFRTLPNKMKNSYWSKYETKLSLPEKLWQFLDTRFPLRINFWS